MEESQKQELELRLSFYKKARLLLGVVGVVVGLCLAVVLPKFKDDLIIRYHLSGWRTLRIFGCVLTAAMFFFVGAASFKVDSLKKRLGISPRPAPKKPAKAARKSAAQDLDTPEGIYSRIEELQKEAEKSGNRAFFTVVNDILDGLDEMNRLQASFEDLSRQNDIDALSKLREFLQEIEDVMCRMLKLKLLNYYLFEGSEGFVNRAPTVLAMVRELLNGATNLLRDVAQFIEQGDKDTGAIASKIQSYRTTIGQFLEEDDNHGNFDYGQAARSGTARTDASVPQAETQPGWPETGVLADTAEIRDVVPASRGSGVAFLRMHGD